jgi:RNA polymerase sigma-70 factor (ECF subfamily)
MQQDSPEDEALLGLVNPEGRQQCLAALFQRHREPLRRMVSIRLDARLHRRLDPSDILQEAFLTAARRIEEYLATRPMPFFAWLRRLVAQKLIDVHRENLGVQARDPRREIAMEGGATPEASSEVFAASLAARGLSAGQLSARAELETKIRQALDELEPLDREVLVLRHFEGLSNLEAARVLGVKEASASQRHLRALRRLKEVLQSMAIDLEDFFP